MRLVRRKRKKALAAVLGTAVAGVIMAWLGLQSPSKPNATASTTGSRSTSTSSTGSSSTRASSPSSPGNFDFYTLALTLAPAFCETEPNKKQCKQLDANRNAKTPLTLHGLWPEYRQPGRYPENCASDTSVRISDLERTIDGKRLRRLMPGVVDGLAGHEWRKHGSCSGLDAHRYFGAALDQTERLSAALRDILGAASGREISADALKAELARLIPASAGSLSLHCKNIRTQDPAVRGKPILMEMRFCYAKAMDGGIGEFTECAAFDRIDQGCGARFVVDGL
jgi:ribonuclease I